MKGKKGLYFLLPLVVLIWGMIAYRVYQYYSTDTEEIRNEIIVDKSPLSNSSDTFNLYNDYEDPFLGGGIKISQPKTKVLGQKNMVSKTANPIVKPLETVRWPIIAYKGIIKSDKNGKAYAVVTINNRERLVKEKDVTDGLLVYSIKKDSIGFELKGERRFLKK